MAGRGQAVVVASDCPHPRDRASVKPCDVRGVRLASGIGHDQRGTAASNLLEGHQSFLMGVIANMCHDATS